MERFFYVLLVFQISFVFLVFGGCDKDEATGNNNDIQTQVTSTNDEEDDFDYLSVITIQSGKKVVLDNPETFIQIAILYAHHQQLWVDELNEISDPSIDPEKFFAQRRKDFFAGLSIRENDFARYYSLPNNQEAVERFLEENPDFKKAYEASMK